MKANVLRRSLIKKDNYQIPKTQWYSLARSTGQGFNQLRFDDTTGQIGIQLHSSQAASQLNLGNLSYSKNRLKMKDGVKALNLELTNGVQSVQVKGY